MIATYGVCWILATLDYIFAVLSDGEAFIVLFMFLFNFIQPIVQASLSVYISKSYEGGVL